MNVCQIFNAKADCILALKGNYPTLRAQVKDWFEQPLAFGFEGITNSYDKRVEYMSSSYRKPTSVVCSRFSTTTFT
ncbi:hypothetical protein [Nostoc sp.]|uniref:hypothetical protein n=1 Tax=Nostoc sp. TaxID=1180 RepID=UPI002FFBBBEA